MDVYLKIGLLSIGVGILLWIFWDSWHKKRSSHFSKSTEISLGPQLAGDHAQELGEDHVGPARIVAVDHSARNIKSRYAVHEKKRAVHHVPENLFILSVMAKPDAHFASYDLLQAISHAGLQFGEMNIFHYYQTTVNGKTKLFSLASANKPGDFDMNNIGNFSCTGLMLFMNKTDVPDPQQTFKLMLDTAEKLTEDL